ncbi:MAG TPA: methyltransferase domain-containing protein, partial [Ktedonobacteraceae bacterium]
LARLRLQDQLITNRMGGPLSEQADPTRFKRVLDIACGTGGWLIEAAKMYPDMTMLIGIDISGKMLDYARAQAEEQQVSDRIEFHSMDALSMLEFPTSFFDLVNMRFAQTFLRKWDWPKLLQEARRVARSQGIIRFTEVDGGVDSEAESSSPAFNRLNHLCIQTLYQAGHYFTPHGDGVTARLVELMHQHGVQNIQTRTYTIEYHGDTSEGQLFAEDMRLAFRTMVPYMKKWIRIPDDYDAIYQQAVADMQAPDFVTTWKVLTAWGTANNSREYFSEQ